MSNGTVDGEDNDDYGRGGLTPADREFLRMSEDERRAEYSRQARSAARSRIRDRVRASLHDFQLLADELDEEEREKIFAVDSDPKRDEFEESLAKMIQFAYAGLGSETRFRRVLSEGVMPAAAERLPPGSHGGLISVRFEVEPIRMGTQLEASVAALKDDDINSMSGDEARALLRIARQSELGEERIDRMVEEWERGKELMEQHREQRGSGSNSEE